MLRTALVSFGLVFLPMAIWFGWRHYWGNAAALAVVSAVFLRLGLSRNEDSWMSAIDDLGSPPKKPRRGINE